MRRKGSEPWMVLLYEKSCPRKRSWLLNEYDSRRLRHALSQLWIPFNMEFVTHLHLHEGEISSELMWAGARYLSSF